MKLYKIFQNVNVGYDTYDTAIVAAKNADDARNMHPYGHTSNLESDWCKPEDVQVEYIGEAASGIKACVICASFNAGCK